MKGAGSGISGGCSGSSRCSSFSLRLRVVEYGGWVAVCWGAIEKMGTVIICCF